MPTTIDQCLFVLCWEASESIAEVSGLLHMAGHFEMTPKKVHLLAWSMRKLGVNLKPLPRPIFPRQDMHISAEQLSEYARSLVRSRVRKAEQVA